MKLSREELEIKILKHLITDPEAMKRVKAMGITEEHFEFKAEGADTSLTKSLFRLISNYYEKSGGSLVTMLVLENKFVEFCLKDKVRGKLLLLWSRIEEDDYNPNELYDLLEQTRVALAMRLWHDMFSQAKDALASGGFAASMEVLEQGKLSVYRALNQTQTIELMTFGDMAAYADEHPTKWLVNNYLLEGGLHYLVSAPACSKTWVLLDLAKAVLSGGTWLGRYGVAEQGNVLYIDEEMGCTRIHERLAKMGLANADGFFYTNRQGVKIDNDATLAWILDVIKTNNIKLVCIDSLVRIHASDENSNSEMRHLYDNLKPIMELGATVMINHHKPKGGTGMRGAGDLDGQNDGSFEISKQENGLYKIKQSKHRHVAEEDGLDLNYRLVDYEDNNGTRVRIESEVPHLADTVDSKNACLKNRVYTAILDNCGMNQSDIVAVVGGRKADVLKSINELEKEGSLVVTSGPKNSKLYSVGTCSELLPASPMSGDLEADEAPDLVVNWEVDRPDPVVPNELFP